MALSLEQRRQEAVLFVYFAYIYCRLVHVYIMLDKNSLAVKKVRGQSEATMVISDQKL